MQEEIRTVNILATFEIEITLTERGFREAESLEHKNSYLFDHGESLEDLSAETRKQVLLDFVQEYIGVHSMYLDYSRKRPCIALSDNSWVEYATFENPVLTLSED